ncbi:MAG TPA: flagellar hook-length control protein FliK [candidate division Zixibacteria bacterium]|nr:flagellar hook-length control protein FliK [candidate division Zixibacteria bacterium]
MPNPGRGAKESVYPATRPNNPDTEIVRQAHASKAAPEPELETTPKQAARTVGIPTAAIAEQSRELRWRRAAPRAREVASEASRLLRPAVHQLTAAQVVRTGHAAKPQSQVVTTPELPVKIIPFSAIEDVAVVSKPAESAVMSQVSTEVPVAKAAIDVKADAVIEPRFEIETPKPLRVPGQITVRLEPRELGRVRIALSTGRSGVIGRMRVEDNHVRQVVERDLPKLRQALLDAGVRVERFEIQTQSQARNVSMVWVGDERGQHQQFERSADQRFAEHGMTQQEREDTPSQDERRQPHMGRLLWRNPWNSMTTDANHLNLVA